MSNIAIICEYNPFHNGHKYQIDTHKRELGASGIIAVMSGNFVQRGEAAVTDKWNRARMALLGGCDLVIELPVIYATQSAERFATGAVKLINALGIVDYLSFGSECADIRRLSNLAELISSKIVNKRTDDFLKTGVSYPKARAMALESETGDVLSAPNNILAVEYIKALKNIKSSVRPVTLERKECAHNAKEPSGDFASAGLIRKLIKNDEPYEKYIPLPCIDILKTSPLSWDDKTLDGIVTYLLRTLDKAVFARIADMDEGIHNRFIDAARMFCETEKIAEYVKTKRYTRTRIDRILINILLNITKDDLDKEPMYIRVLGFNKRGEELLRDIKRNSKLPIITKTADVNFRGESAEKMFLKDVYATDIYSLLCPPLACGVCGLDYKTSPVIAGREWSK